MPTADANADRVASSVNSSPGSTSNVKSSGSVPKTLAVSGTAVSTRASAMDFFVRGMRCATGVRPKLRAATRDDRPREELRIKPECFERCSQRHVIYRRLPSR